MNLGWIDWLLLFCSLSHLAHGTVNFPWPRQWVVHCFIVWLLLSFWNLFKVQCLILLRLLHYGLKGRVVHLMDWGFLVATRIDILDLLRLVEDLVSFRCYVLTCLVDAWEWHSLLTWEGVHLGVWIGVSCLRDDLRNEFLLLAERLRFAWPDFILGSLNFVEEASFGIQAILLGWSELNLLIRQSDWSLGIKLQEIAVLLNTAFVSLFVLDGGWRLEHLILTELGRCWDAWGGKT